MKLRIVTALALAGSLSSCTTWEWLWEGENQQIIVKTDPPLADCTLTRNGIQIAHINPTPGAVYIPKTKYDIVVTCSKAGYRTVSSVNDSDTNGATVLRTVLFGPVQWVGDSITGGDNKYDSPFVVPLPAQEPEQPQ